MSSRTSPSLGSTLAALRRRRITRYGAERAPALRLVGSRRPTVLAEPAVATDPVTLDLTVDDVLIDLTDGPGAALQPPVPGEADRA